MGLVLLAVDPGSHIRHGAAVGGLLAAALSAPHVVGPWTAQRLDRARDGRRALAVAYLAYAVALTAGSWAVGRLPIAAAVGAVALAGCCGPLLTGGLSSRLAGIAGADHRSQRRAQGWDALTYSIGATGGPAVVASLATLVDPLVAMTALGGAAAVGAALTLTLPPSRRVFTGTAPGIRAGLSVLITHPALRRVTAMTMLSALPLGAFPVIAVVFGPQLADRPGAAATLTVACGLGNLVGSLIVTIFPLRGDPETLARRLFLALAAATALCAFAPTYPLALAGFALIGLGNATSFTATLAARSTYAPPDARTPVFVTSAGLKIALASVGAAATGGAAGLGGRSLLVIAAAITTVAVLTAVGDRTLTRRRSTDPVGLDHADPLGTPRHERELR
ncbi:hypothetical protein [Actinoallomurus acaciae]|uniref:MFS transporter n=1 Tax=Actinoallomurus acaciae TaxID=502577 RepID=A0ABV5Y8V5_9ACTN